MEVIKFAQPLLIAVVIVMSIGLAVWCRPDTDLEINNVNNNYNNNYVPNAPTTAGVKWQAIVVTVLMLAVILCITALTQEDVGIIRKSSFGELLMIVADMIFKKPTYTNFINNIIIRYINNINNNLNISPSAIVPLITSILATVSGALGHLGAAFLGAGGEIKINSDEVNLQNALARANCILQQSPAAVASEKRGTTPSTPIRSPPRSRDDRSHASPPPAARSCPLSPSRNMANEEAVSALQLALSAVLEFSRRLRACLASAWASRPEPRPTQKEHPRTSAAGSTTSTSRQVSITSPARDRTWPQVQRDSYKSATRMPHCYLNLRELQQVNNVAPFPPHPSRQAWWMARRTRTIEIQPQIMCAEGKEGPAPPPAGSSFTKTISAQPTNTTVPDDEDHPVAALSTNPHQLLVDSDKVPVICSIHLQRGEMQSNTQITSVSSTAATASVGLCSANTTSTAVDSATAKTTKTGSQQPIEPRSEQIVEPRRIQLQPRSMVNRACPLKFGVINMRSAALDNHLVGSLAQFHNLDVLVLTEIAPTAASNFTVLIQEDKLNRRPARSYTCVWKKLSDIGSTKQSSRGVGVLVDSTIFEKNTYSVSFHADRIMTLRFKNNRITYSVVCAYAPTTNGGVVSRDDFWCKVEEVCAHAKGRIVLLGDLNAHVADNNRIAGHSRTNENGKSLTELCASADLFIHNLDPNYQKSNLRRDLWTWRKIRGTTGEDRRKKKQEWFDLRLLAQSELKPATDPLAAEEPIALPMRASDRRQRRALYTPTAKRLKRPNARKRRSTRNRLQERDNIRKQHHDAAALSSDDVQALSSIGSPAATNDPSSSPLIPRTQLHDESEDDEDSISSASSTLPLAEAPAADGKEPDDPSRFRLEAFAGLRILDYVINQNRFADDIANVRARFVPTVTTADHRMVRFTLRPLVPITAEEARIEAADADMVASRKQAVAVDMVDEVEHLNRNLMARQKQLSADRPKQPARPPPVPWFDDNLHALKRELMQCNRKAADARRRTRAKNSPEKVATMDALKIARRNYNKAKTKAVNEYYSKTAAEMQEKFNTEDIAESFKMIRRHTKPSAVSLPKDSRDVENALDFFHDLLLANPKNAPASQSHRRFASPEDRLEHEKKFATPEQIKKQCDELRACDPPLDRPPRPDPSTLKRLRADVASVFTAKSNSGPARCGFATVISAQVISPLTTKNPLPTVSYVEVASKNQASGKTTPPRGDNDHGRAFIEATLHAFMLTEPAPGQDPPMLEITATSDPRIAKGFNDLQLYLENDFSNVDHADLWKHIAFYVFERNRPFALVIPEKGSRWAAKAEKLAAYAATRGSLVPRVVYSHLPGAFNPDIPLPWHRMRDDIPDAYEINKAMSAVHNSAPGADKLKIKEIREDVESREILVELVQKCWEHKTIPNEWRSAILVCLPKKPGASSWDEHRGITLLSHASKVLARIILDRARGAPLLSTQHGFLRADGTTGAIFVTQCIDQLCHKTGVPLTKTFVDLKKAYDWLPREVLWDTMERYGFGPTAIAMVKTLYTDRVSLKLDGIESFGNFTSECGVRQGCLLSPLLFNLVFDRVCRTALSFIEYGGVDVFNSATKETRKFLLRAYADDVVLFSRNPEEAKHHIDCFDRACKLAGLTISVGKTEVMQLPDRRVSKHMRVPDDFTNTKPVLPPIRQVPADEACPLTRNALYYALPALIPGSAPNYECPINGCTSTGKDAQSVRTHLDRVHLLRVSVLDHGTVPRQMLPEGYLISPVANPPEMYLGQLKAEQPWKCDICPNRTFPRKAEAVRHCKSSRSACRPRQTAAVLDDKPSWMHGSKKMSNAPCEMMAKFAIQRQAVTDAGYAFPHIPDPIDVPLDGTPLKNTSNFKYLGKQLTTLNSDRTAIKARLQKFNETFFTLKRKVFLQSKLRRSTKLKIYETAVLPQLMYSSETMVLRKRDELIIDTTHRRHLRSLTGVNTFKKGDAEIRYPPDYKVYTAAATCKVSDLIKCQQLRFYGHVLRRPNHSDLKFLMEAREVACLEGRRSRTDKMDLVSHLKKLATRFELEDLDASQRGYWRGRIKKIRLDFERIAQTPPIGDNMALITNNNEAFCNNTSVAAGSTPGRL